MKRALTLLLAAGIGLTAGARLYFSPSKALGEGITRPFPREEDFSSEEGASGVLIGDGSFVVDNVKGQSVIDLGDMPDDRYVLTFSFKRLSEGDGSFSLLYRLAENDGNELRVNMLQKEWRLNDSYWSYYGSGDNWPLMDGNAVEQRHMIKSGVGYVTGDLDSVYPAPVEGFGYYQITDFNYYTEEFRIGKKYECRLEIAEKNARWYINGRDMLHFTLNGDGRGKGLKLLFDDPVRVEISDLTCYTLSAYAKKSAEDIPDAATCTDKKSADLCFEKLLLSERFLKENADAEIDGKAGDIFREKENLFREKHPGYYPGVRVDADFEPEYNAGSGITVPDGFALGKNGEKLCLNKEVVYNGRRLEIDAANHVRLNESGAYTVSYYSVDSYNHRTEKNYDFTVTGDSGLKNIYDRREKETAYWADGSPYRPVMRFIASSDNHFYNWYLPVADARLAHMLDDAYAWSDSQQYNKIDALVMIGDFVELGTLQQYRRFEKVLYKHIRRDETQQMIIQAGHETIEGNEYDYMSFTGCDLGMHLVMNGYDFISLACGKGGGGVSVYDDVSTDWLRAELKKAVIRSNDPTKPIFVFHHHDIPGTVSGSSLYHVPVFSKVLKEFPQIVYFSGHSHSPIVNPRAIFQDGNCTYINTGSMQYMSVSGDCADMDIQYPPLRTACAGMYLIEIDAKNRIRILPYNLVTRDFMKNPGTWDHSQIIRYIDNAGDPSSFRYTSEPGKNTDSPVFLEGTEVNAVFSQRKAMLEFDQAADADGVNRYEIRIYKGGVKVAGRIISSMYYMDPIPPVVTAEIIPSGGFEKGEYTVEIVPVDCFNKYGASVVRSFTFG